MISRRFCAVVGALLTLCAASARAQDAQTLKEQARAIYKRGDYRAAIVAYKKAEAAALRQYGPNDQQLDVIGNELAAAHVSQGEFAAAIPIYERVKKNAVNRRNSEHYHYNVAVCLNNLGTAYREAGDDMKAEEVYLEAKELLIAEHGKDYPYLAVEYSNLANLYRDRGDFARAFEHYDRSLKLYEQQEPRTEEVIAKIAIALNGLASAKSSLGQFAEAEKLNRESLRLRMSIPPPDHPSIAVGLSNVGGTLIQQGKLDEALTMYEQSLKIREKKLGPDHVDVAVALNNLAELQRKRGKLAEAEKLHRQSLAIREAKLGPEHGLVAFSLHNLASLLKDSAQEQEALKLYERSLKINRAKYGDENPDVAKNYFGQAVLFAKLERWDESAAALDQSRRIIRKYIAQVLPSLKPAEQLAFLKTNDERNLESSLAAAYHNRGDQKFIDLSAAWLLNAKGVAQQALAERETLARDKEDPAVAATAVALERTRSELARAAQDAGKAGDNPEARKAVEQLKAEEQRLAKELAAVGGQPTQGMNWVELADARKNLPADGVLIQIARFRPRDFKALTNDPARWLPPRYAAWLIPATGKGDVRFVDLGPADKIEAAVRDARSALENAPAAIQADGEVAAEEKLRGKLQPVADLLLMPCLAQAGAVKSLFLNPDSSLWLVPWAALPLPDKRYVVENYTLTYVVSGRDLLPTEKSGQKPAAPIIFADPDYDLTPANVLAAAKAMWKNLAVPTDKTKYRSAAALGKVQRLAATAQEAALVAPRLEQFTGNPPVSYTGRSALEVVARRIRRPQVLVISTHGFFLPEPEHAKNDDAESASTSRGKAAENPLLRCGLLFGGCNLPPAPDMDDGVLTGMEIVRIDLRGTELVVLSACQTGLGDVTSGEGVAGLRQAFQLAGAKSVLATLWEIPDNDTARLMIEFFGQLADGKDKAAALRAAQIARIEARREKRGAAHPFYWGAFTLTGRQ